MIEEHPVPSQVMPDGRHPRHAGPGDASTSLAVFTIVQDEPRFLPLWLRFYSRLAEHLIVIDNDTRDGSVERATWAYPWVQVVHLPHESSFDHQWLRDSVERQQCQLLKQHRFVLFTEADEFVLPDPRLYPVNGDRRTLERYAMAAGLAETASAVRCQGYEIVHDSRCEPALDWDQVPLLRQRRFWARNRWYSKTVLASAPLQWSLGFHEVAAPVLPPREDLYLLHLHRVDYEYAEARHASRLDRKWSEADLHERRGLQNRLTGAALEEWFYHPERAGQDPLVLETMPEFIQDAL